MNDWKYNKYAELLDNVNQREKFYQIYLNADEEVKKRLFLFISFNESNEIIKDLLNKDDTLITAKGLRTLLLEDKNLFNFYLKFKCSNDECEYNSDILESSKIYYNKCPKCEKQVTLINKQKLENSLYGLYLNYFDYYLVSDYEKTIYIIHNKYANKYYMKGSDESLSNWIYLKLLENGCPINLFLLAIFKDCKNPKNLLLKWLKEQKIIKIIDALNFKPILENTFKENNKTYFNIFSGNENLNKQVINQDIDLSIHCPNIIELLNNLTGYDKKGVEYIISVLSMILQEPHLKTKQLIIFYGEEASGKGTFYDLVLKPIFEGYITKILGKKIKSSFNGFMSKNLILVLEEIKADKEDEDTLKELVTEEYILINEKGLPERYENNYLTIFGFSNEQNPINAGKRRGVYFRSRTLGGSLNKAPDFRDKYEKQIPLELPLFITHLKTRQYDKIKIMKGHDTEAKNQVLDQNLSMIERFWKDICNYPELKDYVEYHLSLNSFDLTGLEHHTYKFENARFVSAEFLVTLYNAYLRLQKMNGTTLNKFSQFWQLSKIDKTDKDVWRRLVNPANKRKTQYLLLDKLNYEIKKEYDKDD